MTGINRCKTAVQVVGLFLAAITSSCGSSARPLEGTESAVKDGVGPRSKIRQPNVLLVLTDDLDEELGSMAAMPRVQELLTAQGTSLEQFYISFPTCCPSRSSILRGQYTHSHQVLTNAPPAGGFEKVLPLGLEASTLATWLQDAGYRTVLAGKYLNGYPLPSDPLYIPKGWTEWYSPVDETAYDAFNYRMNENGKLVSYADRPEDYITDVLAGQAEAALRRKSSDPRPYFVFLSVFAPHAPAMPAPRHKTLFADAQVPRGESFNEVDVGDKPSKIHLLPPLYPEQVSVMDAEYRARLQTLQAVDEMVARLVAVLEETDQLRDTYVIFTSDNGYHLGQHRLPAGKTTAYEEDIHVPFIVRGPGIPAGRQVDGYLAGNVDIAPTLAELAGAELPDFVEGRSLMPLLRGDPVDAASWRQAFLLEGYAGGYRSQRGTPVASPALGRPGLGVIAPPDAFDLTDPRSPAEVAEEVPNPTREVYVGLRSPRFTFVELRSSEFEFYDNLVDPLQLTNLAATLPPDLLDAWSKWASDLHACSGASCRNLESRPLPQPPERAPADADQPPPGPPTPSPVPSGQPAQDQPSAATP